MLKRTLQLATLAALLPFGGALAQPPPNYDKLKSLLEKKFAPAETRSLAPGESATDKEQYQWIKPKDADDTAKAKSGTTKAAPAQPRAPIDEETKESGSQKSGSLWTAVYAFVLETVGLRSEGEIAGPGTMTAGSMSKIKLRPDVRGADAPAADERGVRSLSAAPAPAGERSADAGPAAAVSERAGEIEIAQAEVPVAKKNSYVIQIKPDASEEQISALLQKYGFNVTKVIGALGVITVELIEEPEAATAAAPEEGTRSLAPGDARAPETAPAEAPPDPKASLEKILEPPIIKQLRSEPIVDAAIVNSTIGTKLLPRPSGASLKSEGKDFAWRWHPDTSLDGNWGLKSIRMPPVWSVLDRYRKRNPDQLRPKIGVIDAGFAESPHVPFQSMIGVQKLTVLRPDCATHHAMHVSGIIGARQGDAPGIDGMIPDARLDAVAISNQATNEAGGLGVEELWELQTLLFDEVLGKTMDYLVDNVITPDNLRVINISLGYNFLAKKLIGTTNLDAVEGLKLHIHHQASIIRRMAQRVEDSVLFVVAAGNDSEDRTDPLPARWASPFAWAGTFEGVSEKPARNILVVEASDRAKDRAGFSNTGGHVAAPGVDIMSTLAGGNAQFAVCSGTSQASPYAAALAAILFELDPTKKPADVIEIIRSTATPAPGGSGAAPSIDALEAVLQIPGTKALLADLDDNGKVDAGDLGLFKSRLDQIREAAATEAAFSDDLNGDGVVDDNECFWPTIDFNGSGSGATQPADFKKLGGLFRSDLNVLAMAWSETPESYDVALQSSGLSPSVASDTLTASSGKEDVKACRRKDGDRSIVVADAGTTEGATPPVAEAPSPAGPLVPAAEPSGETGGQPSGETAGGVSGTPVVTTEPSPTGDSGSETAAGRGLAGDTPTAEEAAAAPGTGAVTDAALPTDGTPAPLPVTTEGGTPVAVPAGEAPDEPAAGEATVGAATRTEIADGGGAPTTTGEPSTANEAAAADDPEAVRSSVLSAVASLKKLNPRLRITINPATGLPSSITGFLPRPEAGAALGSSAREGAAELTEEETKRAIEGFFATSGLTAAFPTKNKNVHTEYLGRRRDPDFPDRFIASVEQRVGNIPVFGSAAKLTVEGLAGVTKYVGTPSQVAITDTDPSVDEASAITAARLKLGEIIAGGPDDPPAQLDPDIVNHEAKAQLIIYDPALIEKTSRKPTRLAWLVEIDSFRLFVDAENKEVFHYYRDRPTGALRRIFDLEQGKIFPGRTILDEEAGVRDENIPPDGELAFRFTGDVRDFFFLVFGRSGFDDNDGPGPNGGSTLESYIRYSNARDAFWCPSKSYECPKANVMVYGPGYASSIDIVGHEMTHGVIMHEKNLLYLNEPGAVNESLADIFGTLIELHARVPYGNWVIGESAPGFSEEQPLRSLANPNLTDAEGKSMFDRTKRYSLANRGQPDNYEDVLTTDDTLCGSTRYQDNGCVHFNSGILNKMAYLISEGGEHRGIVVNGIGRIKLARIAYRTMTAQLNESSGLIEAADGFALSCLELAEAGTSGISSTDCEEVFAAQQAVSLIFGS